MLTYLVLFSFFDGASSAESTSFNGQFLTAGPFAFFDGYSEGGVTPPGAAIGTQGFRIIYWFFQGD